MLVCLHSFHFNYVSRTKSSQGLAAGLQNITIHRRKTLYFIFFVFATLCLHVLISSVVSIQDLPLDFSLLRCPLHLH